MSEDRSIIGLGSWLASPAGTYLLNWEQARLDLEVADIFGFHALQIGLPGIDTLRANRMPHRWIAAVPGRDDAIDGAALALGEVRSDGPDAPCHRTAVSLCCEPEALPFDSRSLDLVVLPHTLELADDPHAALAEVDRVLRPEGRVVVVGFNPASLWALRQRAGRIRRHAPLQGDAPLFMPREGEFIGYRRLRDWLRLLSFEVEGGRFGCYRPPVRSQAWLDRFDWMDHWGDRWWPVFGAVYCCVAVKRVRGMRLVGLAKERRPALAGVPVAASQPRSGLHHAPAPAPTPATTFPRTTTEPAEPAGRPIDETA